MNEDVLSDLLDPEVQQIFRSLPDEKRLAVASRIEHMVLPTLVGEDHKVKDGFYQASDLVENLRSPQVPLNDVAAPPSPDELRKPSFTEQKTTGLGSEVLTKPVDWLTNKITEQVFGADGGPPKKYETAEDKLSLQLSDVTQGAPEVAGMSLGALAPTPVTAPALAGIGAAGGRMLGRSLDDYVNYLAGSEPTPKAHPLKDATNALYGGMLAEAGGQAFSGLAKQAIPALDRQALGLADDVLPPSSLPPMPPSEAPSARNFSREMGGARFERSLGLADPEARLAAAEKLDPEGLNISRFISPDATESALKNTAPREVNQELYGQYFQQLPKGEGPNATGFADYARSLVSAGGEEGSLIKGVKESVKNISKQQTENNDLISYGNFPFPSGRTGAKLTEETALDAWKNFPRDPQTGEIIGDGVVNTIARSVDTELQKRIADEGIKNQVILQTVKQLRALPQKDVTIAEVNQLKRNFGIDAKLEGPSPDGYSPYANTARLAMKDLEESIASRYGDDGARLLENNGKISRYLPVVQSIDEATKKAGQGQLPARNLRQATMEALGLNLPKQTHQQVFEASAAAMALREPEKYQLGFQPQLQSMSRKIFPNVLAKGRQQFSDYVTGPVGKGGNLFVNSSKAWRNFITDDVPGFLTRTGIITQADTDALLNAKTEAEYITILEQMAQNNPAVMELVKESKLLLPSEKSAYEQQYREYLNKRSIPPAKALKNLEAVSNNERPD